MARSLSNFCAAISNKVGQGCCASSPSNSSPYPAQHGANSSSRAITSSQPPSQAALNIPRPSTNASNQSSRPHHHHHHHRTRDLTSHINRPLKPHVWASKNRTWTRQEIDSERTAFFDTRVDGRPEIWLTIKAALEVLWDGDSVPGSNESLETAQQILGAAGITLTSGNLAGGVYDSFGARYELPEYIVADPTNLVVPRIAPEEEEEDKSGEEAGAEIEEDQTMRRREEKLRRKEEKGKEVINPADMVDVAFKLSDRETVPTLISVSKKQSIRMVLRKIWEHSAVSLTCYSSRYSANRL
jgi:hypothetical protein